MQGSLVLQQYVPREPRPSPLLRNADIALPRGAAPRRPAMASVLPRGPIEYVAWPSERLVKQLAKSSYAKACLLTIIAAAQAQKLEASSVSLSLSPSRQSSQDDVSNSNTRPIP